MPLRILGITAWLAAVPWPAACAATAPTAADGAVEVVFVQPERYRDAGIDPSEAQFNLAALRAFLQREARRWLQPGQSLHLEIDEVDLAGRVLSVQGQPRPLRLVADTADWPRVEPQYTLRNAHSVQRSAIASVSDPAYLQRPMADTGEPLRYERRMLAQWLRHEFGTAGAAPL